MSYLDEYEPMRYSPSADQSAAASRSRLGYGGDPTRFGPGPNDWTWQYGSPSDFKSQPSQTNRYGYSRGGGYYGGGGGTRTSVSTTTFTMPRPKTPDLPTLELPKVDKRAVAALAQRAAAPGIRSLRETVQQAMGASYENPNVRRMTLREALQGYGAGLEKVMAGAQAQARQEHQQELNLLAEERQQNWRAQVQRAMDSYNKAWSEYLASAKKTTTQTSDDDGAGGTGGYVWKRLPSGALDRVPVQRTGMWRDILRSEGMLR
jgi:hypothetical protein